VDLGIRGRKAIINGGSAGLGKASAIALAREGVTLFIAARTEERLLAAAREIEAETGAQVTPVNADYTTAEGRAQILDACPEPDIVINTCSPPAMVGDYRQVDENDWLEALSLTLIGPIEFMRGVVDGMTRRGFGRIVNIASVAAKYPTEVRLLSGPPRSALINYSVAVAKKVAKHNVVINTLLPGTFYTPGFGTVVAQAARERGISEDEALEELKKVWLPPTGRFGDAEELGAFCALFCSRYAGYVTGQSLVIDGGGINMLF